MLCHGNSPTRARLFLTEKYLDRLPNSEAKMPYSHISSHPAFDLILGVGLGWDGVCH